MALAILWCNAKRIVQYVRSRAILDATGVAIGQVFAPYHTSERHGHFGLKNQIVALCDGFPKLVKRHETNPLLS
jgi:hypothetical protein